MSKKKFLSVLLAGSLALSACAAGNGTDSSLMKPDSAAASYAESGVSSSSASSAKSELNTASSETDSYLPVDTSQEFTDLSFLTEEQRELYEKAAKASWFLFGGEGNLGYQFPGFEYEAEGNYIPKINGYFHYKNSYQEFDELTHSIFTQNFLDSLGEAYTEKFIDYNGKLATLASSKYDRQLVEGCWRGVEEAYPDTFRWSYKKESEICFYLIAHYDRNWNKKADFDIFIIEYPIRMVKTENGWRVNEFHTAQDG